MNGLYSRPDVIIQFRQWHALQSSYPLKRKSHILAVGPPAFVRDLSFHLSLSVQHSSVPPMIPIHTSLAETHTHTRIHKCNRITVFSPGAWWRQPGESGGWMGVVNDKLYTYLILCSQPSHSARWDDKELVMKCLRTSKQSPAVTKSKQKKNHGCECLDSFFFPIH